MALTLRGRVFVAPASQDRIVRADYGEGLRYRNVVVMPNGENLLGLSDITGEIDDDLRF